VAKKFKNLQEKMSPKARAASEEKAAVYSGEMALDELRTARRITQESLAKVLGVKQSAISKIERRTDMYVSTLESVIEAMGGRLEIEAVFPEGKVKINQEVRRRKLGKAV
jgi:DNA-binding XRE family transcriptional regulator